MFTDSMSGNAVPQKDGSARKFEKDYRMLMNDTFVVSMYDRRSEQAQGRWDILDITTTFHVFCFDEGVLLAGAHDTRLRALHER